MIFAAGQAACGSPNCGSASSGNEDDERALLPIVREQVLVFLPFPDPAPIVFPLCDLRAIKNKAGEHRFTLALQETKAPDQAQIEGARPAATSRLILSLLVFLFFARGLSTVLVYSLIPKLKSLFHLSYTEAMLTQLCFFLGYFIFSLPAAFIVRKLGYLRAIVFGLGVTIAGCLVLSPLTLLGLYPGFLTGLFVLAAGITLLQVADNPLIARLGHPSGSSSRLTLAQAFNSLGTTVAPILAAWLIFAPGSETQPSHQGMSLTDLAAIQSPFIVIAGMLAVAAVIFWLHRSYPLPQKDRCDRNVPKQFRPLGNKRFLFGAAAIFLYVGAEVAIGSMMASYLMEARILSVSAQRAAQLSSLYWGGAMCGRFAGAVLLRLVPPGAALAAAGAAAMAFTLLSLSSAGVVAAAAIIAVGLFNSIMFPTIFALALEGLGDAAPEGSGILCMAIVGGAIVPEIAGIAADARGIPFALLIPAACYAWITIYGLYTARQPAAALA